VAERAPDISDLNPVFAQRLAQFRDALTKAGINTNVVSGYRSPELQSRLYANYQAKQAGQPLPFPQENQGAIAAAPWRSFHNYGLAADVQTPNYSDYQRMWGMAPQYGLAGLGAKDANHFQLAGSLADDIAQYHLANWRPASQPAPASGAIAYGAPPGQPSALLARTGRPAAGSSFLDALAQIESQNKNIFSTVDKDYPGQPGSRSQGYFQIDTPTWQQFAAKAGIDVTKYPTAMNAPREVQAQVAGLIPLSRFGGRTQRMLQEQYGHLDTSQTIGQLGTTLNAAGGPSEGPTTPAGGPPATPATPPPGTALPGFQPGSPANTMAQNALKSLGGSGGGGGGEEPQPMRLQQAQPGQATGGPMMMGPGGQNVQGRTLAQPASYYGALAATRPVVPSTVQSTIQPMAPGQATGVPGMPGTTLNSPSQLQMALMSGQMSPYDMYANAGYGGGFGST